MWLQLQFDDYIDAGPLRVADWRKPKKVYLVMLSSLTKHGVQAFPCLKSHLMPHFAWLSNLFLDLSQIISPLAF